MLLPFDNLWGPGGLWLSNVLKSALPLLGDTLLEHQDPVSHTARYMGIFLPLGSLRLPMFSRCSVGVVPLVDVFFMYFWGGR